MKDNNKNKENEYDNVIEVETGSGYVRNDYCEKQTEVVTIDLDFE